MRIQTGVCDGASKLSLLPHWNSLSYLQLVGNIEATTIEMQFRQSKIHDKCFVL